MAYKLYGFINETQAREVDALYLDGYNFGDRLLEGVIFHVRVAPGGDDLAVSVDGQDEKYLKDLNARKWLREAKKHALTTDVLATERDMSDDAGFIVKEGEEPPFEFEVVG